MVTLLCPVAQAAPAAPAVQATPATAGTPSATARTPLLQEGKKTLFQRVVSHPGAVLYAGPRGNDEIRNPVRTFSVFYVYARDGQRLEVGPGASGAEGWLDAAAVTEWPQAITMTFTERLGRMPVLFFKDHDALVKTCTDANLGTLIQRYASAVEAVQTGKSTTLPADVPLLAAEPAETQGAVARSRFYLMPVLAVDDQFGEQTRLLQVASIDPGEGSGASGTPGAPGTSGGKTPDELRTALVFVVDTTISMKPYIEQTKTLLRSILDELEKSPNGEKVAFAVVAYRNSPAKSPKIGYLSQVVSDFKTVKQRKELEKALDDLQEATASTHSFDEDALAGVKTAVEKLSWDGYASRAMLVVSDAGFLSGSDPASATRLDAAEMADFMRANSIWPTVAHVKTPTGEKKAPGAAKQWRDLTRLDANTSSYIEIDARTPNGGAAAFGKVGKALAEGYKNMVEATASGKLLAKPATLSATEDPEARARELAAISGYAMQLDFLGARRGVRAPSVVSAWIADADLEKLSRSQPGAPVLAAQPAVLLTKNQLSDLAAQLKIIIEQAERTKRTDARDFFESILSASAQLARDPSGFSRQPGRNLAESGAIGEYLQGLPYKSDILLLREEDWYNMSTGEQTAFINRLKSKLARYEDYDRDRDNWESFGAPNPGDWVYRVPLSVLP